MMVHKSTIVNKTKLIVLLTSYHWTKNTDHVIRVLDWGHAQKCNVVKHVDN